MKRSKPSLSRGLASAFLACAGWPASAAPLRSLFVGVTIPPIRRGNTLPRYSPRELALILSCGTRQLSVMMIIYTRYIGLSIPNPKIIGELMRTQVPPSLATKYAPLQIDDVGSWLVLSDLHLPYHDVAAVNLAINAGKRAKCVGVLLNGDILDSHEISRFDHDPTAPRYVAERDCALLFLAHLRASFPKARIIFKEGNHDERLAKYLMSRAPALFGFSEIMLPAILKLSDFKVEHVGDKRVVRLGKLNVLHGHEYPGGTVSPVNPARGLFLKARSVALCGHHHQTSEHHEPDVTGSPQAAWSMGCLCQLHPSYMPLNKWNHGFAVVHIADGGSFAVRNYRIIDGAVA